MASLRKVCIVGAESTGKSTLAQAIALASHSRGHWAQVLPETLRLFTDRWGRVPRLMEERLILESQVAAERQAQLAYESRLRSDGAPERSGFLLCDSSVLQIAFTSAWYFKDDALVAEALSHQSSYTETLFLRPTIPWVADKLQRDGIETQRRFDADLEAFLKRYQIDYKTITNDDDPSQKGRRLAERLASQLADP